MKKTIILLLAATSLAACTRVEPGNVGVKVNRYGSGAGVESTPLGVGSYQTAFGVDVYEFPISTKSFTWGRDVKDEDGNDTPNNELVFQDKNGLVVTGDVAISYRVDPTKAPVLFQKYRIEMPALVAGPLKQRVQGALVEVASNMAVEEVYGPKKTVLINSAMAKVQKYFAPFGLIVEQLSWAGPIRIPKNIEQSINARAKNEQAAIAASANVATIEAEARAAVAQAQGEADSTKVKAIAEAEAIRIRAAAIADNPKIVAYQWVEKWNGSMPSTVYCSSSAPCVQGGQ